MHRIWSHGEKRDSSWICLFDAWKKFPKYYTKWWFDGDESHGAIRKNITESKQIQRNVEKIVRLKKCARLRVSFTPGIKGQLGAPLSVPMVFIVFSGDSLETITHKYPLYRAYIGISNRVMLVGVHPTIPLMTSLSQYYGRTYRYTKFRISRNPRSCWWLKSGGHQLIGSLSHYFQGFIHPRWWSPDFFHQPHHQIKIIQSSCAATKNGRIEAHSYHIRHFRKTPGCFQIPPLLSR